MHVFVYTECYFPACIGWHHIDCNFPALESMYAALLFVSVDTFLTISLNMRIRRYAKKKSRKGNSKTGNNDIDCAMYRYRHLVENAMLKIKKYRVVATRYDKLARNYHSVLALALRLCGY